MLHGSEHFLSLVWCSEDLGMHSRAQSRAESRADSRRATSRAESRKGELRRWVSPLALNKRGTQTPQKYRFSAPVNSEDEVFHPPKTPALNSFENSLPQKIANRMRYEIDLDLPDLPPVTRFNPNTTLQSQADGFEIVEYDGRSSALMDTFSSSMGLPNSGAPKPADFNTLRRYCAGGAGFTIVRMKHAAEQPQNAALRPDRTSRLPSIAVTDQPQHNSSVPAHERSALEETLEIIRAKHKKPSMSHSEGQSEETTMEQLLGQALHKTPTRKPFAFPSLTSVLLSDSRSNGTSNASALMMSGSRPMTTTAKVVSERHRELPSRAATPALVNSLQNAESRLTCENIQRRCHSSMM